MGESRDLVLILDGSSSMSIQVDGQIEFFPARLKSLPRSGCSLHGSAAVSILLAGAGAEIKTPVPMTDPVQLEAVLNELRPVGGMMALHDALRTAALVLSAGSNAAKQIVLITDDQKAGWATEDSGRWDATAQELKGARGSQPELLFRFLETPAKLRNVAVTEIAAARKVIGTDRPLPIQALVVNAGQTPVAVFSAYLTIDGRQVGRRPVGPLEPHVSESVGFSYRFDSPGPHVIDVKADVEDDLPDDNHRTFAIHVLDRLPVLVVDGRPAPRLRPRLGIPPSGASTPVASLGLRSRGPRRRVAA